MIHDASGEIRRIRIGGSCLLLLGVFGVAIGAFVPEAGMELLLGALLVVLSLRVLWSTTGNDPSA